MSYCFSKHKTLKLYFKKGIHIHYGGGGKKKKYKTSDVLGVRILGQVKKLNYICTNHVNFFFFLKVMHSYLSKEK